MIQYHPIATQIYNLLIQDEITKQEGEILFDFLNISVKINEKSAVGDLFQEWFAEWMRQKNINFRTKQNTQEFPDFLVDENSNITGLLEIKSFYSSANFDVANFEAYCDSLTKQAYRLDADYLIFSYDIQDYKFKVKKVWLKKIWEITGKSDRYPVRCQAKRNVIYNIRPISWYSEKTKYKPFPSRYNFVTALYDTLMQYHITSKDSDNWLERVKTNYWDHTQGEL
jgi:type II restriction enzyme